MGLYNGYFAESYNLDPTGSLTLTIQLWYQDLNIGRKNQILKEFTELVAQCCKKRKIFNDPKIDPAPKKYPNICKNEAVNVKFKFADKVKKITIKAKNKKQLDNYMNKQQSKEIINVIVSNHLAGNNIAEVPANKSHIKINMSNFFTKKKVLPHEFLHWVRKRTLKNAFDRGEQLDQHEHSKNPKSIASSPGKKGTGAGRQATHCWCSRLNELWDKNEKWVGKKP